MTPRPSRDPEPGRGKSGGEMLAMLRRLQEQLAELPEPVYIVLDHSWSPSLPRVEGRDSRGRKYVLFSPAVLDAVRHVGRDEPRGQLVQLMGIPLYRREDMSEGWPDA